MSCGFFVLQRRRWPRIVLLLWLVAARTSSAFSTTRLPVLTSTTNTNTNTNTISFAAGTTTLRIANEFRLPRRRVSLEAIPKKRATTTTTKTSETNKKEAKQPTKTKTTMKPGNLLLLPFILLLGADLVLNIVVLTKRTFEFFVLGQAPSTETWF